MRNPKSFRDLTVDMVDWHYNPNSPIGTIAIKMVIRLPRIPAEKVQKILDGSRAICEYDPVLTGSVKNIAGKLVMEVTLEFGLLPVCQCEEILTLSISGDHRRPESEDHRSTDSETEDEA